MRPEHRIKSLQFFSLQMVSPPNLQSAEKSSDKFQYPFIELLLLNIEQNLPYQPMFEDLQQIGLQLSKPAAIDIPLMEKPQPHLLSAITKIVKKGTSQSQILLRESVVNNFLNEYFLVGQEATLILYKYSIQPDCKAPKIKEITAQALQHDIIKIHCFARRYMLDRGEIPIIVESDSTLTYCIIDLRLNRFIIKHEIKCPDIIDLNFFSEMEMIILTRESLFQVKISSLHKLLPGKIIPNQFGLDNNQILLNGKILGKIDEDKDSDFKVVLCTLKGANETIKIKQYDRLAEQGLKSKHQLFTAAIIAHDQTQSPYLQNSVIHEIDSYICIQTNFQIVVIKKKFNTYLQLDTLVQKNNGKHFCLSEQGMICSLSANSFSLNYIKLADPKCECKLLDEITVSEKNQYGNFKKMWMFKYHKENYVMFVFEKDGRLSLSHLIKMDPMEKLFQLIEIKGTKDIKIVQELGENLGIPKKEFYLKLWVKSEKEVSHIYQYLLPCEDIKSIKTQIRSLLRRKALTISELLKILEKVSKMLHQQLKTSLSHDLLKQYAKNSFLRKKIKLYAVDRAIDCKSLQAIYGSSVLSMFVNCIASDLFPKEQTQDPMQAMVQYTNIHDETNLKHVMQEFKLILLEQYRQFLSNLLKQFPGRMAEVLGKYPYLLPNYPFHIESVLRQSHLAVAKGQQSQTVFGSNASNGQRSIQPLWFSEINHRDWERELNRNQIEEDLHKYYSTSKIRATVDSFLLKDYGKNHLLKTHCLINTLPQDFQEVVDKLTGIKLFLYVCELSNWYAIQNGLQKSQVRQLVRVFEKKNKLSGEDLQNCRLYSEMHFFMIKNDIFQEEKMTIEELIEVSKEPENLVALFFLGNRQKKQLVLRDFRNLYSTVQHFNSVIQSFGLSENCSKIELYILLDEISNKGSRFQVDNQDLINIIVHAFCTKLEIREGRFIDTFLKMIGDIQIDRTLAMKVNKISKLKECSELLEIFNWEKKTYEQILNNSKESLENLLESYFTEKLKTNEITIQGTEFTLDFPRNMLNVLLFMKENVFYEITQRQVLLIFGYNLVQWKQFQTIKSMIYDQKIPQKLDLDSNDYIKTLITKCLNDTIYKNEEAVWSEDSKEQIQMILSLAEKNSPIRIKEQAKLQLIQIFTDWGYTVAPMEIWLMTMHWKEINKNEVMFELIDEYIDSLGFRQLSSLYQLLDTIEKEATGETSFESQEFISYCLHFSDCLLKKCRYQEIIEVLAFVKSFETVPISYNLISEVFLQCLTDKYRGPQNLPIARSFVEFYVQYFEINQAIKALFESNFDESCLTNQECYKENNVSQQLCFPEGETIFKSDDLYRAAVCQECSMTTIYNFYFLEMMVRVPKYALTMIQRISYNIEALLSCLARLEIIIDENSQYWGINISEIYKMLRKGLYLQAIDQIKDIKSELKHSPEDFQLDLIKKLLRKDKQANADLLKNIQSIENHINSLTSYKSEERRRRFDHKIMEAKRSEINIPEVEEEPVQINVTLKYKELTAKKVDISRQYENVSEIEMIDQIFDDALHIKLTEKQLKGNNNTSILSVLSVGMERSRVERYCNLIEAINNQEFDKIMVDYKPKQIEHALEAIFVRPETTIQDTLEYLESFNLGDPHKIRVGRMFKVYEGQLAGGELKEIFKFDFFARKLRLKGNAGEQSNTAEVNKAVFESLTENLLKVLYQKHIEEASVIAEFFGNIFGSNLYKQKVYLLGIEGIILTKENTPRALRRLRDYIRFLAEDEEFFTKQISELYTKQTEKSSSQTILRNALAAIPRLPNTIQKMVQDENRFVENRIVESRLRLVENKSSESRLTENKLSGSKVSTNPLNSPQSGSRLIALNMMKLH